MTQTTMAWVLHAGAETGAVTDPGQALTYEPYEFADPGPADSLVEPLIGSWEANIDHALRRVPIDVCSTRREPAVVLGNFAVVRVLAPGADNPAGLREGDQCLLLPFGPMDEAGYAHFDYAYDAPGTMGMLAHRAVCPTRLLLPLPSASRFSLEQWATYGRYFTAWDNWHKALACWRAQMPDADPADHVVFGWGGGVSLALTTLARQFGFRAAMTASSDDRLALLAELGVTPVDRRAFPALAEPDQAAGTATREYAQAHRQSLKAFAAQIEELTGGRGVAIFADNLGQPLFKATRAALGRQGVVTTCGWKAGMRLSYLRAAECIARHIFLHTHVWRFQDSTAMRDHAEATGWLAPAAAISVVGFDAVPELASAYSRGAVDAYFPLFRIDPGN
jgi:NADPH:quinone reductase-like Zn-dependent oxidoreductase